MEQVTIGEADPRKAFGTMLYTARRQRGWSAARLIEEMRMAGGKGVAKSAVSAWENGKQFPRAKMLEILASVLDISFGDIERTCRESAEAAGRAWVRPSSIALVEADDADFLAQTIKSAGPLGIHTVFELLAARLRNKSGRT